MEHTSIKSFGGWKKYNAIIYAIAALLVITLVIIFLAYRNTQQSTVNTDRINVSARLSTFAQDIKNGVYNIDIYAKEIMIKKNRTADTGNDAPMQMTLQNIRTEQRHLDQAASTFEHTLNTFINGGTLSVEGGRAITISALQDNENRRILQAIEEVWLPYSRLINNFSSSLQQDQLRIDAINYATDYARIFNDRISALSEQITNNLTFTANEQSRNARIFLTIGFIAALLVAAYLIFIAFHQLVKSDQALERSQRELNDIMDTITEGLFLVDEDLRIGEQHSAELENILRTDQIANRKFTDLLKGRVSDNDIDLTEGFLEQLFNKNVYEELIDALNPLNRIHIYAQDGSNNDIYLSFTFHRVYEGKKIKNILVSVRDVTENVLLEKRLEQERIENEAKLEMLSTILQVDTDLMRDLLRHIDEGAQHVNSILKSSGHQSGMLKNKLIQIGRTIHGLKGEASALSLSSFTKQMEKIEDDITLMRNKSKISGNDFLSLTVHLDELLTMNDKARFLFERIAAGNINAHDIDTPQDSMSHYLSRFAEQVAERNGGKRIELDCHGLDHDDISEQSAETLRNMSLQLMRNAIVHGIEMPNERIEAGKAETGKIDINLERQDDGSWQYSFSDDGAGINFEKLRTMAAQDVQYQDRDADTLTRNELLRYMFSSGTSTAAKQNEDAGRGVGMDVIRTNIKQLDGKLQIYSETGQYTRFIIKFPHL